MQQLQGNDGIYHNLLGANILLKDYFVVEQWEWNNAARTWKWVSVQVF